MLGIGKIILVYFVVKLEGYDVIESNVFDSCSKKFVENGVMEVVNNILLLGYFVGDGKIVDVVKKKIVLVMDEVDGMFVGDCGGVGVLVKFCKKIEVFMIFICNDCCLLKMKLFDYVVFDIKF